MDERFAELARLVSWSGILGYLNFSEGKPDARFQKQLSVAYGFLAEHGVEQRWSVLHELLTAQLADLHTGDSSAFRDVRQAEAVLRLVFAQVLPAYRGHHADLLFHLTDGDLFQPFFLARVFEAVLAQGPPWDEDERIRNGALVRLNDFVGYRPVAILETRPRGEPYDHERVRPIPLFLRGAGVGWGRYHDLVSRALDLLTATDADIRADAHFDLELLDELALDSRAYDHGHPVNRRPNYLFGEWDPHHLDNQGRYRRFVVRQATLDALLDRVEHPPAGTSRDEALFEGAAVLAGTVLMAAGISGSGPAAHDSTATLATLMPRIARYRDAFYANLMSTVSGPHGDRLRHEATTTRQPFGAARQHLNQYLAQQRAAQLQQRHLTVFYAEIGSPSASRQEAARIPVASVRILSEILGRITSGKRLLHQGDPAAAARLLPEIEDLLHRGIGCGALVDPWNILGFQGLFPLSPAREESIQDPRVAELVHLVEQIFDLYAQVLGEGAAAGQAKLVETVKPGMRRLATWWDRFATVEVSDVRRVHGGEAAASAEHVATALARWHERGEATADLAFWRQHLEGFRSPRAFASVVEALLRKEDYRAAMALLMNWLGQAEQVPLDDDDQDLSFHGLALRWMLAVMKPGGDAAALELATKFFDYLEANAEDYWQVPSLEVEQLHAPREVEGPDEDLYGAAYEDVTYQDTTGDEEGAVADGGEPQGTFHLETEGELIKKRLRFLSTLARLWQIAARHDPRLPPSDRHAQALDLWLAAARANQQQLLTLLDALHAFPIPRALGSFDSLVEYDRRRLLKEDVIYTAINTCLDTAMAVGSLQAAQQGTATLPPETAAWEPLAMQLEQALFRRDAAAARAVLPNFLEEFRHEPLLLTPLADGGQPRQILRVRIAQTILRALAVNLPRLGLLRETGALLKVARAMEQANPPQGRGMTEFNHLFQAAFQAVVETVVASAQSWDPLPTGDRQLAELLETLTGPFLKLWIDHSRTLQLSTLEGVRTADDWRALGEFIRRYGNDLFHARFLTLANLRGILHRGVGDYLDYLRDNPDPLHPVRLLDDLDDKIRREDAVRHLNVVLLALVENYEEYKDYNTTTAQSDYGENLHIFLDLLRVKVNYERHAWQFRPLVLAHEVLARSGRTGAAILWQEAFNHLTRQLAEQHLQELARLEQRHGVRLRTVSDRIQERFVKPLALDRLCALIGPAIEEAQESESGASFERLRQELEAYTATPTGVGLDVPQWLRRLQAEVQRSRAEHTAIADLAVKHFQIPRAVVSHDDLERQMTEWDKPLDGPASS